MADSGSGRKDQEFAIEEKKKPLPGPVPRLVYHSPGGVDKLKLDKSVFRYIEHELYNYKYTIQTIADLRENIIGAVPLRETVPGTGYISDPTARKATKLVTNTALARMTRTVAAIERALSRLTQNHRTLFELKYCKDMPWKKVCNEMPVSERTYFRLRRELVYMVAMEMGLAESWQE